MARHRPVTVLGGGDIAKNAEKVCAITQRVLQGGKQR